MLPIHTIPILYAMVANVACPTTVGLARFKLTLAYYQSENNRTVARHDNAIVMRGNVPITCKG